MPDPHEHMNMPGMVSPELNFSATANNLCCEVAPAETAPGPPTRAAVGDGSSVVLSDLAAVIVISEPNQAKRQQDDVPRASSPPQALLCVFLI